MSKKVFVFLVVCAMLFGSVAAWQVPVASAQSDGCRVELNSYHPNIYVPAYGSVFVSVSAGETFTITVEVLEGAGTHELRMNGVVVGGPKPLAEPVTYTFPADGDYFVEHVLTGEAVTNITWTCGAPVAGCDVLMNIPDTAVGGSFVADAATYWKPGEMADTVIAAGNTARVLGVDATREYYKIIWVCDYLWVPVTTMGPNYDAVWNGAPLPTGVIE